MRWFVSGANSTRTACDAAVEATEAAWLLCCFANLFAKSGDRQSVAREFAGATELAELDRIAARPGLGIDGVPQASAAWMPKLPIAVEARSVAGDPPSSQRLILLAAADSGVLTLARAAPVQSKRHPRKSPPAHPRHPDFCAPRRSGQY